MSVRAVRWKSRRGDADRRTPLDHSTANNRRRRERPEGGSERRGMTDDHPQHTADRAREGHRSLVDGDDRLATGRAELDASVPPGPERLGRRSEVVDDRGVDRRHPTTADRGDPGCAPDTATPRPSPTASPAPGRLLRCQRGGGWTRRVDEHGDRHGDHRDRGSPTDHRISDSPPAGDGSAFVVLARGRRRPTVRGGGRGRIGQTIRRRRRRTHLIGSRRFALHRAQA